MNFKYIYALLALPALAPLAASAQLRESVQVSGEYQKEILYPDKLGQLPQRLRIASPESDIPYALGGVEAEFVPSSAAIAATASGASRGEGSARGYLSLQMGSWLNASLAAGVTAIDNDTQTLDFWLRHASTSLWQPYKDLYEAASTDAPRRFSYQEALGLRWNRRIGSGRLETSLAYRLGYFNYYGLTPDLSGNLPGGAVKADAPALPTRVTNDLAFEAGYSSAPFMENSEAGRNRWSVNLGLRHYGYNLAAKETHVRLSGDYSRMLGESADYGLSYPSVIGVDMDVDGVFYGMSDSAPRTFYYNSPDGYGNVRLSPFYRLNTGNIGLRIGFNADLTFNADGAWHPEAVPASFTSRTLRDSEHYSLFHISPDVRFDYAEGIFAVYIHAGGGQQLLTMASLADRNMYALPYLQSTTPVFVPVDAKIGFRLTPLSGLSVEVAAGYRLTRNVPYCGWDMIAMNEAYYPSAATLPELAGVPAGGFATLGIGAQRYNLSGLYVDVNAGYKIGSFADLHAALQYSPQNASNGIFNGADRPRWILTPGFEITPVKALSIGLDYEYRGVRRIWSGTAMAVTSDAATQGNSGIILAAPSNGSGTSVGPATGSPAGSTVSAGSEMPSASLRLPDITRLNARAAYRFGNVGPLRNFTLGVEAKNLLNHNDVLLPGLPSEGLTVMGSVSMQF